MKAHWDVNATVQGRGRLASPMLGHLYPWESPVLNLQEAK